MYKRRCKITYICHGSTINTEQNRLSDDENYPPLNEKGRYEVERLTDWLIRRSPKVDRIYTSPSLRTIQSARILSKKFKHDFDVIDALTSRKAGLWSGLTFEQIEEKYPDMLKQYHKDKINFWAEGGETTAQLNERVQKTIESLINANPAKRLIVVTHNEIIQSAISQALEIPTQHQSKIYIPTGSASQVSYYTEWNSLVYSGYIPL